MIAFDDEPRVKALRALSVLDTPPEERFDRLTRLAAAAFKAPIVLVSLLDRERQWFKSRVGLEVDEIPRSAAFCSHAVAQRSMLVVPDALQDERFALTPLVLGAPHIRFYAGQPLCSPDGHPVGTLCIIDTEAREFDEAQRHQLRDLAALIENELNQALLEKTRQTSEPALQAMNADLKRRIDQRTDCLRESNEALRREIRQREAAETALRANELRIRTIVESSFSAFVSIDAHGCVVDWNGSAERTFGWLRTEAAGRELVAMIIPEPLRPARRADMKRFLSSTGPMSSHRGEVQAMKKDGRDITVEMTICATPSDDSVFFSVFFQDISERLEAQRALEQKQALLNAVLESIDVGVVACSGEGELTLFNRAARELHGVPVQAVKPSEWATRYDLFGADGKTPLERDEIPLFRALQGEVVKDAAMVIAPQGMRPRDLLASGCALTGACGECLGAVVVMHDVTDLNESQRQLRQNEQRLRAIADNLPTMIGQVDRNGYVTFVNSKAAQYFGKPGAELIGSHVRDAYSAADYERVEPYFRAALAGERASFEDQFDAGGKRHFYHASCIPDVDAQGCVNGFYAMAFDITQRKNSELRQHESEERLRTITNNLPVLISYLDVGFNYQFANALHEEWYGVAPGQMIGRGMEQVFGRDFFAAREQSLLRCLAGHTVHLDLEVEYSRGSRIVHKVLIPHLREGLVLGVYCLSTDVTATRCNEAQLRQLADTDPLTGVPNRRSYEVHLAAAIARARRAGSPLALMYLDLDYFKRINDTFGHAVGDEVLKEFARRLKAALRTTDAICRLAGDEFAIVLEGVHCASECAGLADKVIDAMREPFALSTHRWPVTASVGVAWSAVPVDAQILSTDADAALYKAKAAGRACYVVANVTLPDG